MTLEDSFQAAFRLLDQRGQLLNGHLLRLVDGNKDFFATIRSRLIAEGVAEDRFGVGLARSEFNAVAESSFTSDMADGSSADEESTATFQVTSSLPSSDWFLMTGGVIQGPMELATLCQLRQTGEIQTADVVRAGPNGYWKRPDDVPDLAAIKPIERPMPTSNLSPQNKHVDLPPVDVNDRLRTGAVQSAKSLSDVEIEHLELPVATMTSARFQRSPQFSSTRPRVSPPPATAAEGLSLSKVAQAWQTTASVVGGQSRLVGIILAVVGLYGAYQLWQQPLATNVIYEEFQQARTQITELKTRGVIKQSDWQSELAPSRARVQSLVKGLKDPRTGASALRPVKQELLWAGEDGLLKLLESPTMEPRAQKQLETQFEFHMSEAKRLLEGETRSLHVPNSTNGNLSQTNRADVKSETKVPPPTSQLKSTTKSRQRP